ncbi:uncharacterized protein LOC118645751 [Monomorium pharaonis]|uniref:uncharacterized protein LOC118645751 n=1 Tax=Monomorium pharaonis TaxID=307658 RepID=UPI001746E1F1|nr:uncharacterized protein LOC118645751 [Monomorium pharaonis]
MPKRKCNFSEELKKKYPFMKRGRFDWKVVCTLCSSTISVAHKGSHDIAEHLGTQKHKKWELSQASTIHAVEGTLVYHTIYHHISFLSLDCTMSLNKLLFQDSDVAKTATSNRTKAIAIVKNILSPLLISKTMKEIEDIYFISVSCDTSNHGAIKLLPILIQYYEVNHSD